MDSIKCTCLDIIMVVLRIIVSWLAIVDWFLLGASRIQIRHFVNKKEKIRLSSQPCSPYFNVCRFWWYAFQRLVYKRLRMELEHNKGKQVLLLPRSPNVYTWRELFSASPIIFLFFKKWYTATLLSNARLGWKYDSRKNFNRRNVTYGCSIFKVVYCLDFFNFIFK